jgi:TPR repeat protein
MWTRIAMWILAIGDWVRFMVGLVSINAPPFFFARAAARRGNLDGQVTVALMYRDGSDGAPQDYEMSAWWFRLAAERGDPEAQYNCGVACFSGQGVSQDYEEAARWFRLAAEQGEAQAQVKLGECHSAGHGVAQDYRLAVKWYRHAADADDASAQHYLAVMYDNGTGVLQDHREALRWYRQAAAKGHEHAMANLGAMYRHGRGVQQDRVRAHMWLNLAAAIGGVASDLAASNRDLVAELMTPAQIAEAQRLAQECLASNYKRCGEPGETPATPAR